MGNQSAGSRLLLIGGIGSGKSTVARLLGDMGAVVIDADSIGHEVLEPGGGAHASVAGRWPAAVASDGRIDRKALAAIVFSDESQLRELEALTHPEIVARILEKVDAAGERMVVVEMPLIDAPIPGNWVRVVVVAEPELRVTRVVAKGADEADARRRLSVQPTNEEWMASADHVIRNDGTESELEAAVRELWGLLRANT